jgi:hypothetical protein
MQDIELQQLVQRQASQFCERIAQTLAPLGESPHRVVSDTAMNEMLLYVSSVIDIATGPLPEVNLIDMLVFLRLCREIVERHWIPEVYGAEGAGVAAVFAKSEDDLWRAAEPVLHEPQRREIESLIAEWRAENPDQIRVEGMRLDDIAQRAGTSARRRQERTKGLLSTVKSATRAADQARLLAERGIFLLNRLPFLWRLQARMTAREIVSDLIARLLAFPTAIGDRVLSASNELLNRLGVGTATSHAPEGPGRLRLRARSEI